MEFLRRLSITDMSAGLACWNLLGAMLRFQEEAPANEYTCLLLGAVFSSGEYGFTTSQRIVHMPDTVEMSADKVFFW